MLDGYRFAFGNTTLDSMSAELHSELPLLYMTPRVRHERGSMQRTRECATLLDQSDRYDRLATKLDRAMEPRHCEKLCA